MHELRELETGLIKSVPRRSLQTRDKAIALSGFRVYHRTLTLEPAETRLTYDVMCRTCWLLPTTRGQRQD